MKKVQNNVLLMAASVMLLITGLLFLHLIHPKDLPQQVQATPQAQTTKASPPTKEELLRLVNEERARNGVAPLTEDARLDISAQMKADDEVKYHYFGHVSPNDGKHGYEYINLVGIYCRSDSENLTQNLSYANTAESAVNAWINSPAHHAAMIDSKYTLTGFGIANNQISEHFCEV